MVRNWDWRSIGINVSLIVLGSTIYALGLNAVLVPQGLLSGGVVGVAMILHYLFPLWDIGHLYFLLNIPVMLLGWFYVSRRFMAYTLLGMLCFSAAATWVKPPPVVLSDPLLGALLAGVVCGFGGGVILRSLGSAGGLDILAIYLNMRWGIRVGVVFTAVNVLVLMVGAHYLGMEKALYSIIYVYFSGRVVDAVMAGFNRRKMALIVSSDPRAVVDQILEKVHRGVTLLKGEGAYTGAERDVVLTVTTLTEIPKLKELVFGIDPDAFVIINDTLEVLGKRHGRRKIY